MIEVKNITKKYGKFIAVDDISFEVKDHEVIGFLGPNGAGKSTTMNMITGYIEPNRGKIIINGYDISKTPKKAKRQIGYMPESVPLYNELTVKEFVRYMAELKNVKRKDRKAEVNKVIEETGLKEVENKLIKKISRGYKQRTSLAGALVGNPDILILDEPTVGLDPKQITEIRNLIKQLGKSHTVILSSHILSEVSQICQKVIIINKGKILAVDTPENLEKQAQAENSILITVEDKDNNMEHINKKIKEITDIKLIKNNDDGTKQYMLVTKKETDIRKELFDILPKENITIFELKQTETTLEDAFLKVINNKEAEIKSTKDKEEIQKQEREKELEKMNKHDRREAIKQDKKLEKQAKKEEFNMEWEKEKEEERKMKEEEKQLKKEAKEKKNISKTANANEISKKNNANETNKTNGTSKTNEIKTTKTNEPNKINKTDEANVTNKSSEPNKIDKTNKTTKTNEISKINETNKTTKTYETSKTSKINTATKTDETTKTNKMNKENRENKTNKITKSNKKGGNK